MISLAGAQSLYNRHKKGKGVAGKEILYLWDLFNAETAIKMACIKQEDFTKVHLSTDEGVETIRAFNFKIEQVFDNGAPRLFKISGW